jgi:hypothetical protein
MLLRDKNPYGWGGFRIPMPRSSMDIYVDRRRARGIHEGSERRRNFFFKPFFSIMTDSLKRDLPVPRAFAAVVFGLGTVILLSLAGLFIPRSMEEMAAPAKVEITARLLEEPVPPVKPAEPTVPPIVPKPKPSHTLPETPPKPKARVVAALPRESPRPPAPPVKIVERQSPQPEPEVRAPTRVRHYQSKPDNVSGPPESHDSQKLKTASRSSKPVEVGLPKKDFSSVPLSGSRDLPPEKKESSSFASGTTVDLPSATGLNSDFERPISQGDSAAPVSGRSFSPNRSSKQVSLRTASGPVGGYRGPVSEGPESYGLPQTGENSAGLGKPGKDAVEIPAAGEMGKVAERGFKDGKKASAGLPNGNSGIALGGAGELDPNLFVSLNQLRACIDQSNEDRLRSQLATMLEKKGQCRTGEMIFFFNYPETGWTIQVDLYNPIEFPDKCAALTAAIECIQHSK